MEKYENIDVPEFMKNRAKPVMTREEQEHEVSKAYLKGGLMGVATTFVILGMMVLLAVIEMM